MSSVLFICKQGEDYRIATSGYFRKFSGLFNSARLVVNMLQKNGITADTATARDNNDIDRLVTQYKPTHCIIEAYWVVPEKFEVLAKLHPKIIWIIRIHSEVPFWSTEGVAIEWTMRYLDYPNVILAPNAKKLHRDMLTVLSVKYGHVKNFCDRVVYLSNYYPADNRKKYKSCYNKENRELHIGCFGAIRPLKNQLIQAISAIRYADSTDKILKFHINGNRMEGGGEPVIKNIRKLFEASNNGHELIEHAWQPHTQFLEILATLDLSMQVSFTESFNIVAADMVTSGIPIVTSAEVDWVDSTFHADPTDSDSIVAGLRRAEFYGNDGTRKNRFLLEQFVDQSEERWMDFFGDRCT